MEAYDASILLSQLDKLHTTELGHRRIGRNLGIPESEALAWCAQRIRDPQAVITRKGKNWYIEIEGCVITVNAYSYTVITAHKKA